MTDLPNSCSVELAASASMSMAPKGSRCTKRTKAFEWGVRATIRGSG
jgi:hypothetical protein